MTNLSSTTSSSAGVGAVLANEDFLVSDEDRFYFRAVVQYGFQVIVQCFGIATNVVNITVFLRMGLNDSVTISFFGLAISDLLHLACYLVFRLVMLSHFYFHITTHIAPTGFSYPFSLYAIYFYDVSMYVTVFAAVQKCCCVVFPLRFKNAFTPRRTYAILATIYLVTLAIFLPVLTGLPFVYKFYSYANTTLLSVDILSHYRAAEHYWQNIVKIGLTPVSQVVVIVCLVIMSRKLRASAKFRLSSKARTECGDDESPANDDKAKVKDVVKMSTNEMRALQAVQFVCFVFVVTSLPPSIAYLVQAVYPPFNTPYQLNLKHVIYNFIYFLGSINASVNIFFYLKFNSNYKSAFFTVFRCGVIFDKLKKTGIKSSCCD